MDVWSPCLRPVWILIITVKSIWKLIIRQLKRSMGWRDWVRINYVIIIVFILYDWLGHLINYWFYSLQIIQIIILIHCFHQFHFFLPFFSATFFYNFLGEWIWGTKVPVGAVWKLLPWNKGRAASCSVKVRYVDNDMRVMEDNDKEYFVYTRPVCSRPQ